MIKSRRFTAGDEHCSNCMFFKATDSKGLFRCTKDGATGENTKLKIEVASHKMVVKRYDAIVCDLYKEWKI